MIELLRRLESESAIVPQFWMADMVRVSTSRLTFEKEYEASYSETLFRIVEVRQSDGHNLYKITDLAGKVEPDWFYEKELSNVNIDEREKHRISKVVRERTVNGRKEYLIKWVGYPSAFDSREFADKLE